MLIFNMREIIDLVETARQTVATNIRPDIPSLLTNAITDNDLEEAFSYLVNGHSLDSVQKYKPRRPEDAVEDILDILDEIASQFDSGVLTIYRSISVEEEPDLSQPTALGIYWSYNENYTMGGRGDSGVITLDAQVKPASINWGETIPLLVDGVEAEIRLKSGAPITNVSADIDSDCCSNHFA